MFLTIERTNEAAFRRLLHVGTVHFALCNGVNIQIRAGSHWLGPANVATEAERVLSIALHYADEELQLGLQPEVVISTVAMRAAADRCCDREEKEVEAKQTDNRTNEGSCPYAKP